MKNVLRDWLGINEEKFALEVQLNTLQQKLDELYEKYSDVDDKVESLKYEVEDKVSEYDLDDRIREIAYYDIDDIKNDLDEDMDYSEITDNVFDLVMQEIEDRDTLQELVEAKLETLTGVYPNIAEIVEDVVEQLINKLKG